MCLVCNTKAGEDLKLNSTVGPQVDVWRCDKTPEHPITIFQYRLASLALHFRMCHASRFPPLVIPLGTSLKMISSTRPSLQLVLSSLHKRAEMWGVLYQKGICWKQCTQPAQSVRVMLITHVGKYFQ